MASQGILCAHNNFEFAVSEISYHSIRKGEGRLGANAMNYKVLPDALNLGHPLHSNVRIKNIQ